MGRETKRLISGIVTLLATISALYCIYRMLPYGMAGDADKVKKWFVLIMLSIAVGLIASGVYYYIRAKESVVGTNQQYNDLETLAHTEELDKK